MWNALSVAVGAGLWASDTLFRHPLSHQISPVTIVYFEHIFAALFALVWSLYSARKEFFLGLGDTLSVAFIGIFGSALATILFTMSFQFANPSVSILIQKVQPIFVIALSSIFLKEKVSSSFFLWAALALFSAFWLSFPNGVSYLSFREIKNFGSLFALLAAILWAVSTVVGKTVLKGKNTSAVTFWRFAFGLLALFFLVKKFPQSSIEVAFVPTEMPVLRSLILMALIPGFLGVTLYYRGLSKVPASVATILELTFPVVAVFVNYTFLGIDLMPIQWLAMGLLLFSMLGVSASSK